uniref:Zinc finger Ran-binding domain-containing protein 2 n=1 Tax=Zeugodacus cucurbitae TaxID=28588 RepID=A0A0A1WGV4_ZEUCU
MKNKETNIQQCNDTFLHNMTTMTDLQYRILPETSRGLFKGNDWMLKKSSKDDFTRSYGNQTNFGLLKAKRCDELQELHLYRHLSETKSNFGPKVRIPLSPKKRKCSEAL